jgi:hypothetical protein
MHSCDLCRAKTKTAGELLAWHVNHSAAVLKQEAKPKRVMVWQDMFDPYANGNKSEYKVRSRVVSNYKSFSFESR